ncbi:MAG TPA: RDD family protein [Candidatus Angelobacter sp.]|nr:RDD family protein [Candidatus Angelobacter sp.]
MKWYYVDQGQQAGPVDDAQLQKLHQEGAITSDTLVWRTGLENWIPFREAKLELPASPPVSAAPPLTQKPANPNEVVCAECGKVFPIGETIRHGNAYACAACKPVFLQKLAEGARINTGEFNYGGFWIRVSAKILDGLILGLPFMVVYVLIFVAITPRGGAGRGQINPIARMLPLMLQMFFICINVAFQSFFLGKYGATPGKMLCKLRVVTSDGERIGYGRGAGRALAEMLSAIICYIGYLMVGFDSQKRALHDYICNTRVVHTDR